MVVSIIQEQQEVIISTIRHITQGDWKLLILDETSQKIIDNVVREDDILNQNIANIERIEEKREMNPTMDAIYILSPQPHIVECLSADLDRRRYRQTFLVWTAVLDPQLRRRLYSSPTVEQQIVGFETLSIDFFARESNLVTFRDPWSFPVLYHPACNHLVRDHMQILAQKIASVCITLGEYPKVRFYRPRNPSHEASVLSAHLARFVQEELDNYAQWNANFPPPSNRPQGVLVVTDRSMDVMAPLVHEFTYQAMAHDLLPIRDAGKVFFHMSVADGGAKGAAEEKDVELQEKDKVWVDNRHRHMKDTIDKLMGDFQKFLDQNPHFTQESGDATSLNAIKDMLAGLPQFQEMKEAYSLHLSMAQDAMNVFQHNKLADIASVEQTLATGLDEDFRKPKNVLDQVVRLLDDEAITKSDRLRLIMVYVLFRDGVVLEDMRRLLAHAGLPPQDGETVTNLDLLGARTTHGLKDTRPPPPPVFVPANAKGGGNNNAQSEEYALSRFEPVLRTLLEELARGTLDPTVFPYVKPPLDDDAHAHANEAQLLAAAQGSLRAAKPSWAAGTARRRQQPDNHRPRVVVFMAGGATYSESRACYEVGARTGRDVVLATSHMLHPALFVRQLSDLSTDRRRLDLPMERPTPKAPAHLFAPAVGAADLGLGLARPPPARGEEALRGQSADGSRLPAPSSQGPPTKALGNMTLSSGRGPPGVNGGGGGGGGGRSSGAAADRDASSSPRPSSRDAKPGKLEKGKAKRNIFGLKK